MKIFCAAPVLQVSDLEAAIKFYCEVHGFAEDFRFGPYAGVHRDELQLHLCAHQIWKRPVGGSAVVVFCDEVDVFCADIRARGARIEAEPADQPSGMRDFVVSDPDGNLFTFALSSAEK